MEISCGIVRDLLTLCQDGLASEDSAAAVNAHLKGCAECRAARERMAVKIPRAADDLTPLKKLKAGILRRKMLAVLMAVLLTAALAAAVFGYLTSPVYIPYTPEAVTVSEDGGNVSIALSGCVAYEVWDSDGVYTISAWRTRLSHTPKGGELNVVIGQSPDTVESIYYCSNNGTEDKLIYGPDQYPSGGIVTLPRLSLGYYAVLAAGLSALGAILLVMLRGKSIAVPVKRLMFVPISYLIGQLCIRGLDTVSYSLQRDLCAIVLVALPVYGLIYIVDALISKKNSQEI